MITEDYVSFETAKLLKEKGFDEGCSFVVNTITKGVMPVSWPTTNSEIQDEKACLIALPTLQMAMKWLRKIHNLHIDVDPSEGDWNPTVLELEDWTCAVKFGDNIPIQDSYEKACEAAIKYSLENLI